MIVTNMNAVAGRSIDRTIGMVEGSATVARRLMKEHRGAFRGMVQTGTEVLTESLRAARRSAQAELCGTAAALGAEAVICVSESITEIGEGAFLISLAGTAVVLAEVESRPVALDVEPVVADNVIRLPFARRAA